MNVRMNERLRMRWSPAYSLQNNANLQDAFELHQDRKGIKGTFFSKKILSLSSPWTSQHRELTLFSTFDHL